MLTLSILSGNVLRLLPPGSWIHNLIFPKRVMIPTAPLLATQATQSLVWA